MATMQAALGCTRGLTPSTQTRPAARPRAQRCVPRAVATGSSEGLWLPGVEAPKRLEGLVGNRGFDPFNFAIDPDRLQWCDTAPVLRRPSHAPRSVWCHIAPCFAIPDTAASVRPPPAFPCRRNPALRQLSARPAEQGRSFTAMQCCRFVEAEKTNGRWAMAACAGIMGQELLGVSPAWCAASPCMFLCWEHRPIAEYVLIVWWTLSSNQRPIVRTLAKVVVCGRRSWHTALQTYNGPCHPLG